MATQIERAPISQQKLGGMLEPYSGEHNPFLGDNFITVEGLTPERMEYLFGLTDVMKELVERNSGADLLRHQVVTVLFYEASSRTAGSFMSAIQRLGAGMIPLQGMQYSSVSKGENLPDTVRTFANYSSAIVVRHPEVGSSQVAAEYTDKVVINAGDGTGEHPTQALLDTYTISRQMGRLDNLQLVVAGDVLNGRTIRSLLKLLSQYPGNRVTSVAPEILQMDSGLKASLEAAGMEVTLDSESDPEDLIEDVDVWYHTRVQQERFGAKAQKDLVGCIHATFSDIPKKQLDNVNGTLLEIANAFGGYRYDQVKLNYVIDAGVMARAKPQMILMHPFPRVGEILPEVDADPRAIYFKQGENGMYTRMALLAATLGGVDAKV